VRAGDLVKVRVDGLNVKRGMAGGRRPLPKVCIGIVTGPTLGYYVPVQIGNVNDLYNIERVRVISESR